ncbi:DUF3347 domain-containing protein [Terrimonas pollutisoli]|uniref:DUF3347 domain-containing protein n=1 Tax=Terrimonas pollutisoli TaxID=3034147 RepID=UPI0023EDDE95|nr:DUF3347 domain-containing protein [Terrimonas sp. H1YJ31]
MKKVFAILGIILLLLAGYIWYAFKGKKGPKGPKPVALSVSKHSPAFNQSVQTALDAYYGMSEAFVNWDTAAIATQGNQLKTALDSLKIEELKVDTTGIYESALDPLSNARNEIANILKEPAIDQKRTALNNLSENLRLLFIVVKYDQGKLYWQECPMAFGEDQPGYWLSKTDEVRNPYLGTKHPKYKDGMLNCGGPKDTINFILPDTSVNK